MRAADQIEIAAESADQAEIAAFFAASEGYMAALYPAESNHFVDVATLMKPNVHFLVARRAGVPVGCGAVVRTTDGAAEIKRMWVDPAHRGARIGQRLLAALVGAARLDGTTVLQLETGIAQSQAIALYRAAGFVERCPFRGLRCRSAERVHGTAAGSITQSFVVQDRFVRYKKRRHCKGAAI